MKSNNKYVNEILNDSEWSIFECFTIYEFTAGDLNNIYTWRHVVLESASGLSFMAKWLDDKDKTPTRRAFNTLLGIADALQINLTPYELAKLSAELDNTTAERRAKGKTVDIYDCWAIFGSVYKQIEDEKKEAIAEGLQLAEKLEKEKAAQSKQGGDK